MTQATEDNVFQRAEGDYIFSQTIQCRCGAWVAKPKMVASSMWKCSSLLLGTDTDAAKHEEWSVIFPDRKHSN